MRAGILTKVKGIFAMKILKIGLSKVIFRKTIFKN
jgi:hypothetical protein